MAIELRIVSEVMLDRCAHSLALYALDITDRHARGEEWVFAEVLKVSAVHRSTVDVDPGCKQEMNAFGASITSEFDPDKFGQCRIPGGRQPNASGEGSGWSKVADAEWSIGHF